MPGWFHMLQNYTVKVTSYHVRAGNINSKILPPLLVARCASIVNADVNVLTSLIRLDGKLSVGVGLGECILKKAFFMYVARNPIAPSGNVVFLWHFHHPCCSAVKVSPVVFILVVHAWPPPAILRLQVVFHVNNNQLWSIHVRFRGILIRF